jgi:Tol biopolymer transport system component
MPTRSPDGRRICYSAYHDRGVWIMDSDGRNARKLDADGWGVQWSPVSPSEVAYTKRSALVIHNVDSGKVRDVFPGGASPYQLIHYNFAWSPDGRRIAFLGEQAGAGRELAVVDSQGAEFGYKVHLRTRPSAALTWFADGNRLAFPIKTEAGWYEIHQLDLTTNAVASTLIPGQPTDRNRISVCSHPDGKRLIVLSYEMKDPATGKTYIPPATAQP